MVGWGRIKVSQVIEGFLFSNQNLIERRIKMLAHETIHELIDRIKNLEFGEKILLLYYDWSWDFITEETSVWFCHIKFWVETMVEEGFLPNPEKDFQFEY
jgi:hypothetical protein